MRFEWDPKKAATNLEAHQVSLEEATTVFDDPLSTTFFDPDHSDSEDRYLTFGELRMDADWSSFTPIEMTS